MPAETHSQIASFIWSICNLLRGPYKRNEYRKVILPLTVLRRFVTVRRSRVASAGRREVSRVQPSAGFSRWNWAAGFWARRFPSSPGA